MPRKIRQLKADMLREGCRWRPGKGSHTVWGHSLVPDTITLSGQNGDDARPYQEKEVHRFLEQVRKARGKP